MTLRERAIIVEAIIPWNAHVPDGAQDRASARAELIGCGQIVGRDLLCCLASLPALSPNSAGGRVQHTRW